MTIKDAYIIKKLQREVITLTSQRDRLVVLLNEATTWNWLGVDMPISVAQAVDELLTEINDSK